jgi:hypothetical protein
MAPRLATGRIVWAEIADVNGIHKLRPAVIVTPTGRLSSTEPFDVSQSPVGSWIRCLKIMCYCRGMHRATRERD